MDPADALFGVVGVARMRDRVRPTRKNKASLLLVQNLPGARRHPERIEVEWWHVSTSRFAIPFGEPRLVPA